MGVRWKHLIAGLVILAVFVALATSSPGPSSRSGTSREGQTQTPARALDTPVPVAPVFPMAITVWNRSPETICGIQVRTPEGVVWQTGPEDVLFPGQQKTIVVDTGEYEVVASNCFGVRVAATAVSTTTTWILESE